MRIAVASEGLDVSKHFSSCINFNFYKVENNELVDSRNLPSQEHLCGSQANFLRQIEVRVLICGTISERDIEIMNKAGITVVTGAKPPTPISTTVSPAAPSAPRKHFPPLHKKEVPAAKPAPLLKSLLQMKLGKTTLLANH